MMNAPVASVFASYDLPVHPPPRPSELNISQRRTSTFAIGLPSQRTVPFTLPFPAAGIGSGLVFASFTSSSPNDVVVVDAGTGGGGLECLRRRSLQPVEVLRTTAAKPKSKKRRTPLVRQRSLEPSLTTIWRKNA